MYLDAIKVYLSLVYFFNPPPPISDIIMGMCDLAGVGAQAFLAAPFQEMALFSRRIGAIIRPGVSRCAVPRDGAFQSAHRRHNSPRHFSLRRSKRWRFSVGASA